VVTGWPTEILADFSQVPAYDMSPTASTSATRSFMDSRGWAAAGAYHKSAGKQLPHYSDLVVERFGIGDVIIEHSKE
jgi:hypothetical protein